MNNEKYSKLKYNNKLIKYLEEAYIYLKEYNPVAYKYDLDTEEKIKIEKFEETDSQKNKWVNYYWIEFEKNEVKYKFSLFYKDFDIGSGNVHVLPGVIQLWKKMNKTDNSLEECKVKKSAKDKNGKYKSKSITYSESIDQEKNWFWVPLIKKIYYLNDIEFCLDTLLKNLICKKNVNLNDDILFYTFNGKIKKYTKVSLKYKMIMYDSKEIGYWISFYSNEENDNRLIYSKYGKIQFWRGIDNKEKSSNSPFKYENKKWNTEYKERFNIKCISEWVNKIKKDNYLEKIKLKDFIDSVKNGQKAFDPDINIENEKDMERLDKDFNEFKRICNIVENNIEKSVEEILSLI